MPCLERFEKKPGMPRVCVFGSKSSLGFHCVRHLLALPDITLVATSRSDLNLLDPAAVKGFFQSQERFDLVIHFCVRGGSRHIKDDGQVCMDNLLMYDNVVAYKSHFDHLIYFSSGAALNNPYSPYGFSKKIIDELMSHEPNFYCLRIYNCYGPGEDPVRFISACCRSKVNGTAVSVEQDRYMDCIHIDDLCKALLKYLADICAGIPVPKLMDAVLSRKYLLSEIAKQITDNVTIVKEGIGPPYIGSAAGEFENYIGADNITGFGQGTQQMIQMMLANGTGKS